MRVNAAPSAAADPAPHEPDLDALARELKALHDQARAAISDDDLAHLRRLERWSRAATIAGYATAWIAPNPLSAALLSLGSTSRWTIVAHHVLHGAFDELPGAPERYTSRGFGKGRRRLLDWPDWLTPDAWSHEHNVLHHYHLGEVEDPDLLEERTTWMREGDVPMLARYAVVAGLALTWKLSYYAPRTVHALHLAKLRRSDTVVSEAERDAYLRLFDPRTEDGRAFYRTIVPYALARFAFAPLAFLALGPLGPWAAASVAANSVAAELLTNLHTFLIIVPNHAGDDVHRFDSRPRRRAQFYLRQILGSTNYRTGGDVNDFLHGFLNYQIEHHLFPDLPPRKYREIKPRVEALCAKYGVPYVQESVWKRVAHMMRIAVGTTAMKRGEQVSGG